jgi:hypothetical protein
MTHPKLSSRDGIKQQIGIIIAIIGLWAGVGSLLVFAQQGTSNIQGMVLDAETGESLPSTHVVIESTYKGTITNADGRFSLKIDSFPVTLSFRFIGYQSNSITLESAPTEPLRIKLQPLSVELDEVVVTGEDPAVSIMKEVIKRKQQWRAQLDTYTAQAYTRMVLSSDTSIASISESITTAYWDKEKGHREVVKAKKQTANMAGQQSFAGVNNVPNFYDDIIEVAGFEVIGPTHPDMLKFYEVELVDHKYVGEELVFEIELIPGRKLQPLFVGSIHVLDDVYAMIDVDLKPNEVISFPKPVQDISLAYQQQFSDFGGEFWLPVDMRIDGSVKVGMPGLHFPRISFRQVSTVEEYEVNIALPDSLYESGSTMVEDSSITEIQQDSLWERTIQRVPLTQEEEVAYQSIDSASTMEKAFKPTGALARFVDTDEENSGADTTDSMLDKITRGMKPVLGYNRVEEGLLGLGVEREVIDGLDINARGAYSTGLDKWSYGLGIGYQQEMESGLDWELKLNYYEEQDHFGKLTMYPTELTSLQPLLGYPDYFNYYRKEGIASTFNLDLPDSRLDLRASIQYEKQSSLSKQSDYDLLGRDFIQRANPSIQDGYYFRYVVGANWGTMGNSFGVSSHREMQLNWSQVMPVFNSEHHSSRLDGRINWTLDTFYQRRLLPNQLDVTLSGGIHLLGDRIPQYYTGVDGSLGILAPVGTMRSFLFQPAYGKDHLGLLLEHHFRSIPFEAIGWRWAADQGWGLSLTGGVVKAWDVIPSKDRHYDPEEWQTEAGVSWQGVFGLFRVDLTRNFNQQAWYVTIGLARLF